MEKESLQLLANMGVDMKAFNLEMETNSQMDSSTSGSGEELVPDDVLGKEVMDLSLTFGTFLPSLPGNHGTGMEKVQTVPLIGDVSFFAGGAEKTTGVFANIEGNTVVPTDDITINQKQYVMRIDITDQLSKFNVMGAEKFESMLKDKIAKSMARTIEASIINGDIVTASTGNVNLDDSTPPSPSYYLKGDGLRKVAIGASQTNNVGAMDEADFLTAIKDMGEYSSDKANLLWLFNSETYTKALGLDAFQNANERGKGSTIEGNAITNIYGIDLYTPRDLKLAEADGKQSTTAGNNTLGQFQLLWKPAVQYGFHGNLNMKLYDFGAQGYQLEAWFYFGYAIANKLASMSDPSIVTGINVTV